MKATVSYVSVVVACLAIGCSSDQNRDLFNGNDLSGWDTYLGPPWNTETGKFDTVGAPGLNSDPDKVFSVVREDGEAAMRISGQHFGGISTVEEFSNYHLTLEFKWGQAKYPPKDSAKRDSGLLYHAVGPHAADGAFWMRSQEFQVQEGDCGDYWGVAGAEFDIQASRAAPAGGEGQSNYVYDPAAELLEFTERTSVGRHAVKSPDAEKPSGEWNTLELYCLGDTAVHVVNGVIVMKLYNSKQVIGDGTAPLKKGKIQIQSEGAEVFYRRITIENIRALPEKVVSPR
jgi:hypothetical protein